ncbi:WD repeat-containing protein 54 [Varanus komodoensis]|uniref:WD repeat-containing protein 54 n=1 Tax=Varanus komodoensis TaxID=61221 RepID=UPI001CF78161|nr:WD repeat-containing protein 54 [Varanus komodoensis]KAF7252372.1 WD repeat-containing protein 54 [Varanus komodoensis]
MYRRGRGVLLKESALALYNNLSVLPLPAKQLAYFACVHGGTVNLVSAADDGLGASHRQLQAKEGSLGVGASAITQAAWCVLPSRVLLVLTSRKGIQMYESDGSVMVYWHALEGMEALPGQAVFARGIAASGQRFVCVGTSSGSVLVFDVPSKGTNITLSEVLEKHCSSITDVGAELCERPEGGADLVTADDSGALCVWCAGDKFKLITRITPVSESTCSSVKLWNGVIVAGYGNGQIRLYEAASGTLRAEVNAHARWIYALDLAPHSGKLLSAAEDSFVQVWKLSRNSDTQDIEVEHCHTECVADTLLCGARFCDPEGSTFAVTGFELSEIIRFVQA